jgi:hypothetical protein
MTMYTQRIVENGWDSSEELILLPVAKGRTPARVAAFSRPFFALEDDDVEEEEDDFDEIEEEFDDEEDDFDDFDDDEDE